MPRLTKKLIESTEVTDKDRIIFDDELPGFGLRVLPSGRKIFIVQYRHRKRARRLTIGSYPIVTAEKARTKATTMLAEIRNGNDPMGDKQAYNASPTVQDLTARYLEDHCKHHLKPRSQRDSKWLVDKRILPVLGDFKVLDVERADIARLHGQLSRCPVNANRTLAVISKMFNLAELWGWRPEGTNPARQIKKYPEKERERFLSKDETRRLGSVLEEQKQHPHENLAAIFGIQLLMLTGCRVGEILALKWDYVDWDEKCLRLPDSKTGAKTVYLGAHAFGLLHEIKSNASRPQSNPYVIWGLKEDAPLNNIQKPWRRFRALADLNNVRIHDLRHSFASFAVNQRLSLPMIGKLLGHTQAQTTARYAHLMADPMKEAADSVTLEIGELMAIKKYDPYQAVDPNCPTAQIIPFIPKTNIPAPQYLTSEQAAQYLGVPPRLMENWRWRKVGPKYAKVGHRIRYSQADLNEYLKKSVDIYEAS